MRSLCPIIRADELAVRDLRIFVHKFVGEWDLECLEALLSKTIMDSTVRSRILGYSVYKTSTAQRKNRDVSTSVWR